MTPEEPLELTEAMIMPVVVPKGRSIKRETIMVPAGHVLEMGRPIVDPFSILVEYGVRWHPEWAEPRVTANAWRFLSTDNNSAVGWAGEKMRLAFDKLLPKEMDPFVSCHGQHVAGLAETALAEAGLTVPVVKEPLGAFVLHRMTH